MVNTQSASPNPARVLIITLVTSDSLFLNQWAPRILRISCPRADLSDKVNRNRFYVRSGF